MGRAYSARWLDLWGLPPGAYAMDGIPLWLATLCSSALACAGILGWAIGPGKARAALAIPAGLVLPSAYLHGAGTSE